MKVSVDTKLCSGHAQCNAYGPNVYDLDDDGYCVINNPDVPAEWHREAEDGANACPEGAITVEN